MTTYWGERDFILLSAHVVKLFVLLFFVPTSRLVSYFGCGI